MRRYFKHKAFVNIFFIQCKFCIIISEAPAVRDSRKARLRSVGPTLVGLLNASLVAPYMFQSDALSISELERIQNSHTRCQSDAAKELLNIVIEAPREVYECFLDSLVQTKQQHVFLHIVCAGIVGPTRFLI